MYLVLVLALCAVGFALYRYRAPLLSELSLLRKDFERKTGIGASADRSPAPAVSSEAESSALQSAQAQQSPAPFSPATQSQANGSLGSPSSQTGQQIAAGGAILRNDRPTLPPDQLPENLISSADLAGTVQVSSNAMEAYLVASRVPAYPEAAKADGIQGSVEMQVIVAKDGTVKRVHVIQGDSRLRVAAAEAVYRWKYRPYLVDGEPVEVATTITVNFDLD
jgi:TonB family protein